MFNFVFVNTHLMGEQEKHAEGLSNQIKLNNNSNLKYFDTNL